MFIGIGSLIVMAIYGAMEWYYERNVAVHAKRVSLEDLRKYRRLINYIEENDKAKFLAAEPVDEIEIGDAQV
jgi:hypothetical protein